MPHGLVLECGDWELDLELRELRTRGKMVPIGGRAFEILEKLATVAGQLVTKDELFQRVWPGAIVEDNTLQVHISAIRKAFGEDRGLLKTVSGRGYRLQGNWTVREPSREPRPLAPRLATVAAERHVTNLPAAAAALIGRKTAVERLRDLLTAYRVVTLTGPGGIGKTVLASEVARTLFPTFGGDVFVVELVSLSDADLVPSAVAEALNLQVGGDEMSPASVARALGDKKVLLVLDNCEHVIDIAAATVEALVRQCPNTTVLATSREVLGVEGEMVFRVPPLETPAEHLGASDGVLEHSAVQLFVVRTQSRWSDFRPHEETLRVIAAICRRLDGVPLAIEFAAARAATLGIKEVADHLDDRFALLRSARRTALPRHQTLRATLDWSYELLPEEERSLLRRLAIFPAGFTLEAVTAVSDESEARVAHGISSLVLKSLVTLDGSETALRWRLLETVRAYALDKLAGTSEYRAIARRHAEFYLALFAPFVIESRQQAAIDELDRYRREIDNLRAALNWAFSSEGDSVLGVALAATATDFWNAVSLVAECCEWAGKALALIGDDTDTRNEMVLQCGLGFALIFTEGSSVRAREALTRALALARDLQDFDYRQRATCGLWLFYARAMALNEALAFAHEYEEVAGTRDIQARAIASWLIGVPQTYLAAHAEGGERLQWAFDHYPSRRRVRDMIRLASDLTTSALSHNTVNLLSQGRLDAAASTATNAIEEAQGTNQPAVFCVALAWAGFVFLSLGELEVANKFGAELVDLAYRHGLRPFHALGRCVRGAVAGKRDEPETAVDALGSSLADMRSARYLLFYPFFQVELAAALGLAGRVDEGLSEIEEALRFAGETDCRWFMPEILRTKGELLARRGSRDQTLIEDLFRQSMSVARTHAATFWELTAATSLAEHLRGQDRAADARAVLLPAYNLLAEGKSAPRVKQAEALLDKLA